MGRTKEDYDMTIIDAISAKIDRTNNGKLLMRHLSALERDAIPMLVKEGKIEMTMFTKSQDSIRLASIARAAPLWAVFCTTCRSKTLAAAAHSWPEAERIIDWLRLEHAGDTFTVGRIAIDAVSDYTPFIRNTRS